MKTLKFLCVLALTMFTIPTLGQDFLNVYFKDGTFKIFHFNTIVQLNTSKLDAEGVMHSDYNYQHVVTTYNHFVYDINDIDSIAFTKYDEEVVKNNYNEVMLTTLPELSDCKTAEEAKQILDKIEQSKGVETAWVEGNELFIKIKDWEIISFYFDNNVIEPSEVAINNFKAKLASIKPNAQKLKKPNGQPYKAVIANQQHADQSEWRYNQRNDYMYPLVEKLKEVGYEAEYIPNEEKNLHVDLDFFTNYMYDYDVIFLSTHGGYSFFRGHSLITDISLTEPNTDTTTQYNNFFKNPNYSSFKDDTYIAYCREYRIDNGIMKHYIIPFIGIYESLFENHVTKNFSNPNSIFYNGACLSLKRNNKFANILINDRKLGTYLGYTESNFYGQEAGCTFFTDMVRGVSAEKAYNNLGEFDLESNNKDIHNNSNDVTGTYKDEDIIDYMTLLGIKIAVDDYTASVKLLPENNLEAESRFILPTYTIKVDQEKANQEYNQKQTVTVEGVTNLYDVDSSPVKMGFYITTFDFDPIGQIDFDPNPFGDSQFIDAEIVPKSSEKGNVCFKGTFSNLEPNKTYFYRAFTKDELHFNFGESHSFKLEQEATITTPKVTSVVVTKASYYPDHYDFNGGKYSFKYNCTVTASINPNGRQIQEWGYVYVDPSGSTAKIPLTEFGTSYADSRYSYCLNTSSGTLTFYGYVKYADDPNYYYEEPQQFAIAYPEGSTLNMSECTFKGTETNVSYQGKNYKYKTAYRYVFKPTGAYWLKVGTYEYGSGWNNWTNLPNYTVSPVDGNNALTVNYYYDDKTFTGDYNVKLKGDDETHGINYATPQYVNYTYSGSQFTGCNFHNTSNAQAPNLGPVIGDEEEEVYETVIDIVL